MRLSTLFPLVSVVFIYPSLTALGFLYLFPFFKGCDFPEPIPLKDRFDRKIPSEISGIPKSSQFRLLAYGDPQLEGDTSLPPADAPLFPGARHLTRLSREQSYDANRAILEQAVTELLADTKKFLQTTRKRLDLFGNDFYLAHNYRTLKWLLEPTHVTVLGDLLGSQWVTDEEFTRRSERFWSRVFEGGMRVEDKYTANGGGKREELGADKQWADRVITVPGNHDVGYAGELSKERMDRFEREFGNVNWDITFTLPNTSSPKPPSLHIITLNSMNMDSPAWDKELQSQTYSYINSVLSRSTPLDEYKRHLTLLLTHIPLYKQDGICADPPYFTYHPEEVGGGVREQNQLSEEASLPVLEGLFAKSASSLAPHNGTGRRGLVLNGHDHIGCEVYHFLSPSASSEDDAEAKPSWRVGRWQSIAANRALRMADMGVPGLREVTARSMMGYYQGYATLVSAWYNDKLHEWTLQVSTCNLGVQHIWWAVHVYSLIAAIASAIVCTSWALETFWDLTFGRRAQRKLLERRRRERKGRSRSRTPGKSLSVRRRSAASSRGSVVQTTATIDRDTSETPSVRARARRKHGED